MRHSRLNYVAVGAFVLAMVAATVATFIVLAGRVGPSDQYRVGFADAAGLRVGTRVLYMGYPVGRVEAIDARQQGGATQFSVTLAVRRGWHIPRGSIALVRSSGLLSGTVIDIQAGRGPGSIPIGGSLPGRARRDALSAMAAAATRLNRLADRDLAPLLDNLDQSMALIAKSLNRDGLPLLADLHRLSAQLAGQAPKMVGTFEAMARQLQRTSVDLQAVIGPANRARGARTLANLEHASHELDLLAQRLRGGADRMLGPANERLLNRTLANSARASASFASVGHKADTRFDQVFDARSVARVRRALDAVTRAARDVAVLGAELRASATKVQALVSGLGETVNATRPGLVRGVGDLQYTLRRMSEHVDALTGALESTSQNMSEFSREIRDQPSLLLRSGHIADPPSASLPLPQSSGQGR